MSEESIVYSTAIGGLLRIPCESGTINTKPPEMIQVTRAELIDLKRQLISLLVTVDRVLDEQPSVITRSERRRG